MKSVFSVHEQYIYSSLRIMLSTVGVLIAGERSIFHGRVITGTSKIRLPNVCNAHAVTNTTNQILKRGEGATHSPVH